MPTEIGTRTAEADDYQVKWHEPAWNRCPHCGTEPCLPFSRKLSMWPGNGALCQVCGLKVALDPVRAVLAVLPIFVLVVALLALMAISNSVLLPIALILIALSVIGFPLSVMFWVPLTPDELSWKAKVLESRERVASQRFSNASKKRG